MVADPSRKPANDNVPHPFHVYSMRQAIEEKFILDVLKNYTPYQTPNDIFLPPRPLALAT